MMLQYREMEWNQGGIDKDALENIPPHIFLFLFPSKRIKLHPGIAPPCFLQSMNQNENFKVIFFSTSIHFASHPSTCS